MPTPHNNLHEVGEKSLSHLRWDNLHIEKENFNACVVTHRIKASTFGQEFGGGKMWEDRAQS
jgi:hypothetical protein